MPTNTIPTDVHAHLDGPQTVNLSQAGAFETMASCHRAGIAIVAELHSVEDAEALVASRYGHLITRVLIEPIHGQVERAQAEAVAMSATLRAGGVTPQQFQSDAPRVLAAA